MAWALDDPKPNLDTVWAIYDKGKIVHVLPCSRLGFTKHIPDISCPCGWTIERNDVSMRYMITHHEAS